MASSLFKWLTHKLSQDDIKDFCEKHQTTKDEDVLIVHSDDMHYDDFFPNRVKANIEIKDDVEIIADVDYTKIQTEDNQYDVVVCTGLLEHVPDFSKTLDELRRVLKPGGKVLISASAAFSTHEAPRNFYHFTVFGLEDALNKAGFKDIEVYPSAKPFRTIGILLQRICYQTKMNRIIKTFFFLIAKTTPFFDKFIKEDYGDINREHKMESSLYSNVQAIAYK